jgi:pimeloyl-ACP methyl ester carboxylesterase
MQAICSYTGNNQGRETATGLMHLWANYLRPLASPDVTVYQPATWKSNAHRRLEILRMMRVTRIFLIGYSHGQAVCMEMARLAPQYGIKTVRMALCDPVGRNPLLPRWGWAQLLSARSMTPWMSIRIPETVSRVVWVRQHVNLPKAHDLAWNPETTYVADPLVLNCNHSAIQWHEDWFNLVMSDIYNWINPPKAIPVPE